MLLFPTKDFFPLYFSRKGCETAGDVNNKSTEGSEIHLTRADQNIVFDRKARNSDEMNKERKKSLQIRDVRIVDRAASWHEASQMPPSIDILRTEETTGGEQEGGKGFRASVPQ